MSDQSATGKARRIGSRERSMLILLGIIALLAIAFFALTSGSDDDETEPRARATSTRRASPSPSPSPVDQLPPETDEAFEGKDPFQPLVFAQTGGTGGDGGTGGTPSPGPTGGPTGDGEARRVTLLDIFEDNGERLATVEVDNTEYTVGEGETFADNFRLLDLTTKCGTFVFGDERFTLCLGQEVLK